MELTLFEIIVAFTMVAVSFALLEWFRRSKASDSIRRMMGMMSRVHLDPGIVNHANPQIQATMKDIRRRCARCRSEGFCERWLAGEVEGPNTFCPNASIFRVLAGTTV